MERALPVLPIRLVAQKVYTKKSILSSVSESLHKTDFFACYLGATSRLCYAREEPLLVRFTNQEVQLIQSPKHCRAKVGT